MSAFVALLRGVNLGGRTVAMADLRALFLKLGFQEPQTLLASGNCVFKARGSAATLEKTLEVEAVKRLKLVTEFHIRTAPEWARVVAGNPFRKEAQEDPARLHVSCFKRAPTRAGLAQLESAMKGPERIHLRGREAYIYYPDGAGRSKLTPALLDRHLGRGTARNWNTVLKIDALLGG